MAIRFHTTSLFEEARTRIEDHLYQSVLDLYGTEEQALQSVDRFSNALERLFDMLEQMYQTPGECDYFSEKSSPIADGRYRVFYKVTIGADQNFDITFIDIDDNQQSNLDRFPSHRIVDFDTDE